MMLLIDQINVTHRGKWIGTIGILHKYNPTHFTAELKYLKSRLLLDLSDYPVCFINHRVFVYGKLFVFRQRNMVLYRLKIVHIEKCDINKSILESIGAF